MKNQHLLTAEQLSLCLALPCLALPCLAFLFVSFAMAGRLSRSIHPEIQRLQDDLKDVPERVVFKSFDRRFKNLDLEYVLARVGLRCVHACVGLWVLCLPLSVFLSACLCNLTLALLAFLVSAHFEGDTDVWKCMRSHTTIGIRT